ncbi:MAG TPA: SDR family oxidoreductase [Polyangiaceae bacterium]
MKVFVTGATGLIGTAVVRELEKKGHEVLGLARSDAAAAALERAGATPHRGELADRASLAAGAKAADGVIHLGMVMDFSDVPKIFRVDREAIETMGTALAGKPFVGTTGTLVLEPGKIGTEDDAGDPKSPAHFRVEAENLALAYGSVVRCAPSVHGEADSHGFVPMLVAAARKAGFSAWIGDGENRWPAVHVSDCARVFVSALERGTKGTRYHAVGDEGVRTRAIAEAIGRGLGVPAKSITREEAIAQLGPFLGSLFGEDNPASNALTRKRLEWEPTGLGLLADLELPHYFAQR